MIARRHARAALGLVLLTGCGVTRLQTARTVPAGETRTTVAAAVAHNDERDLIGTFISGIPVDIMVRRGATAQIDWGVRLFMGLGLVGDMKWNLLPADRRTALAVSGGMGTAFGQGTILHVPLTISASHDLLPSLTPYAALGYSTFWIFGYSAGDPSVRYAGRSGTGDGLLMAHAGVELSRASGRALMLEYTYARPVVNDPGDFYGFAANHFFSVGFHTGR